MQPLTKRPDHHDACAGIGNREKPQDADLDVDIYSALAFFLLKNRRAVLICFARTASYAMLTHENVCLHQKSERNLLSMALNRHHFHFIIFVHQHVPVEYFSRDIVPHDRFHYISLMVHGKNLHRKKLTY